MASPVGRLIYSFSVRPQGSVERKMVLAQHVTTHRIVSEYIGKRRDPEHGTIDDRLYVILDPIPMPRPTAPTLLEGKLSSNL